MGRKRDFLSGKYSMQYPSKNFINLIAKKSYTTQEAANEVGYSFLSAYQKLMKLKTKGIVTAERIVGAYLWKISEETTRKNTLEYFINVKTNEGINIKTNEETDVVYKKYITLNGKEENRVSKVLDGSIIKMFDKTPSPKSENDVVCPHFLELKWANGCTFDCAWCYLQGTYRFHPEWKNGRPRIKDFNLIESHLRAFISKNSIRPEIFNAGEVSDSLLAENRDIPFSKFIVDILDKYDTERKHRVLFLTKSTGVKNIVEIKRPDRIIMSFSLNAELVAEKWERAPSVSSRISAAKKVYDAGYITRVRIDPMVPVENWVESYSKLIDTIFSNFIPDRITVGSLRGLRTTITNSKDRSWVKYLSERSNWGLKIDLANRYGMYSTITDYLKDKYSYSNVALCKETIGIWKKLGLNYRQIKCNCID